MCRAWYGRNDVKRLTDTYKLMLVAFTTSSCTFVIVRERIFGDPYRRSEKTFVPQVYVEYMGPREDEDES